MTQEMQKIFENIKIGKMITFDDTTEPIYFAIGIIILLAIIRGFFTKFIYKKTENAKIRYTIKKLFNYLITILIVITSIYTYVTYYEYLGTLIALFTAGLAVALKDPISNLAGWVYIIATRPFEVGDRIKVGDFSGDVIDIRLTQFTMLEIGDWVDAEQSTGRIIHVPNGKVIVSEVINYTKGYKYIWDELSVIVSFESDWKEAKYILNEILLKHTEHISEDVEDRIKEANKRYMIVKYKYLTPIVYTKVVDSGIKLTMRYLAEPRSRRTIEHKIWEEILEKFAERRNIELAYPTSRIYRREEEEGLINESQQKKRQNKCDIPGL